jgi:hypothetical protein
MAKPEAASNQTLPQAILALNPLGYWKLNESSGTTAIDYSGNGRNGTYSGTVTVGAFAGPDGGVYPTFTAGQVTIPDNDAWSFTTAGKSIFMLTRPTTLGNNRLLIRKGIDGSREWLFRQQTSVSGGGYTIQLATLRSTSQGSGVRSTESVGPGVLPSVWNGNVTTTDGIVNTSLMKFYRNSAIPMQNAASVLTNGYANLGGDMVIGNDPLASQEFIGQIAHVAIFNGVLTNAQVRTIMNAAQFEGWIVTTDDDQEITQPVTYDIRSIADTPVIDILVGSDTNLTQPVAYDLETITENFTTSVTTPTSGDVSQAVSYDLETITATPTTTLDTIQSAILALTPVGYWRLDDIVSPPQDFSGNARHIVTNSATVRGVLGPNTGAYISRINTSEIVANDNNVWTPTASGMTVFFITRPTSLIDGRMFMAKCGGGSTNEWQITQTASGIITAALLNAAGTVLRSTSSPVSTVVTNTWQAYCVTFSGNTDTATVTLYKNSNTAIVGSTTLSSATGTVTNGTALLGLGYSQLSPSAGMTGGLAHCAIFTGVLSAANINSIMVAADADGWF